MLVPSFSFRQYIQRLFGLLLYLLQIFYLIRLVFWLPVLILALVVGCWKQELDLLIKLFGRSVPWARFPSDNGLSTFATKTEILQILSSIRLVRPKGLLYHQIVKVLATEWDISRTLKLTQLENYLMGI